MPDDNLPDSGTVDDAPLSFDTATDKLTNLFTSDPEADPTPKDQDQEQAAEPKPEDDDPLGLNVEAEDVEDPDAEEADGPDDIKGGRFAPDSAKVKLADGRTITIADLKSHAETRIKEFQRGFTEKSQALSEEKKTFDAEKAKWSEQVQSLSQFQEYASWYAENFLPKQPTPPSDPNDYVAWHEYRLEMDKYNAHAQAYQVFQQRKQQDETSTKAETEKQTADRHKREAELLFKAMPVLKDPVKGKQVWAAMIAGAQEHFGVTEQEVNALTDHRYLVALRDAIAYRRLKATAPAVEKQVAQRPLLKPGPRGNSVPQSVKERQARTERLRSTGSLDDAVAVLKTFDL